MSGKDLERSFACGQAGDRFGCLVALLLEWLVDGKEANRLVDF